VNVAYPVPGSIILAIPVAIFTSTGFSDAAATFTRISSGLVMVGTGRVAMLYSAGLQNFASANARIVEGISEAILIDLFVKTIDKIWDMVICVG